MILRYTPEAIRDLQALRGYIGKTLGNPKAADRIAKQILDTCSQLKQYPQLGCVCRGENRTFHGFAFCDL